MKKLTLICTLLLSLSSCGKVDNFVLGKDNTPTPNELPKIDSTLKVETPWSANAGNATGDMVLNMGPSVQENAVYTADMDGDVTAFDRKSGDILWEKDLDMPLLSGPASDDSSVVVTNKNAQVIVLDSQTGKVRWKHSVSNEIFAKPAIAEGKIFVKTVDGNLYAFDEESGTRLWAYEHGSTGLVMRAGSSPEVLYGVAIAGFSDGKLDGLKADSGQMLWEKALSMPEGVTDSERMSDIDATPLVLEGVVYVASYQQGLFALSLQTGEIVWQNKKISTLHNMVTDGETIYLTDTQSIIWALDKNTGAVLWKQTALHYRNLTAPALVGDQYLAMGDLQGFVHFASKEDGHFVNRLRPARSAISVPLAAEGSNVYVLTSKGKLVAYQIGE